MKSLDSVAALGRAARLHRQTALGIGTGNLTLLVAVRVALGAGPGALRRTLLAESLPLCGAGAVAGLLLAQPLLNVAARHAARAWERCRAWRAWPSAWSCPGATPATG